MRKKGPGLLVSKQRCYLAYTFLLVLLLLSACGPLPTPFAPSIVPPAERPVTSVNVAIEQLNAPDLRVAEQTLQGAVNLGAQVLLVWDAWWNINSQSKDQFNWQTVDTILMRVKRYNRANNQQLTVAFYLTQTPYWASSDPHKHTRPGGELLWDRAYPPQHPQDYSDFLVAFLNHALPDKTAVSENIRYLQLWNEPDTPQEWHLATSSSTSQATGKSFGEMINPAYATVKRVDPAIEVLFGGLSTPAHTAFLEGFFVGGGRFDIATVKLFDLADLPLLGQVRATLQRGGAGKAPLWITGAGLDTKAHSPAEQARYYTDLFSQARQAPGIKSIAPFTLVDARQSGGTAGNSYGLLHADYSPKPAFGVVKEAFARYGKA